MPCDPDYNIGIKHKEMVMTIEKGVKHKRLIARTYVQPENRRAYTRTNYHRVLCLKSWADIIEDDDLVVPEAKQYDKDVTCPECLVLMANGRRSA